MAIARTFLIGTAVVFGVIFCASVMKKRDPEEKKIVEIVQQTPPPQKTIPQPIQEVPLPLKPAQLQAPASALADKEETEVDRISQLFALDSSKLPFVETISFTSRVPWSQGQLAWISDYARYYETSRHFIARSLNRKPDYFNQKVSPGDRFNVFKKGKQIAFHLLIDLSKCKMWFYVIDQESNIRTLLKTYRIGLGRLDSKTTSGFLTPVGKYQLGNKIAIYKPGIKGHYQDQDIEMIRIFGTRWIPFDKELEGCSEAAKGFGLHGAPWILDGKTGELVEDKSKISKYDSDGCIRLAQEDIEELFAIIITKQTTVELVKDIKDAKLPGIEKGDNL